MAATEPHKGLKALEKALKNLRSAIQESVDLLDEESVTYIEEFIAAVDEDEPIHLQKPIGVTVDSAESAEHSDVNKSKDSGGPSDSQVFRSLFSHLMGLAQEVPAALKLIEEHFELDESVLERDGCDAILHKDAVAETPVALYIVLKTLSDFSQTSEACLCGGSDFNRSD